MLRADGYALIVDPTIGRPIVEYDTIQCGHCQRIVRVKPGTAATVFLLPTDVPHMHKEEAGAFCGRCMRAICLPCHHAGVCRPFELWLDEQESKIKNRLGWGRFFRFVGVR